MIMYCFYSHLQCHARLFKLYSEPHHFNGRKGLCSGFIPTDLYDCFARPKIRRTAGLPILFESPTNWIVAEHPLLWDLCSGFGPMSNSLGWEKALRRRQQGAR